MLPREYQEVEYLGCSGAQWIMTGIFPDENTKIEISAKSSDTVHDKCLFGVRANSSNPTFHVWFNPQQSYTPNYGIGSKGNTSSDFGVVVNTWYDIKLQNGSFQANEKSVEFTPVGHFVSAYELPLFTLITGGTVDSRAFYGECKGAKLYAGDTLVRHFTACYRKSDGKPGLYDEVNGTFHVNQGAGADFTVAGALVIVYEYDGVQQESPKYTTLPHTITRNDLPPHDVDGFATKWYYDSVLENPVEVGDVIDETVTLYGERYRLINKAEYGDEALIDLTADTVLESDVRYGKIFHKSNGLVAEGRAIIGDLAEPVDEGVNFIDYDGTVLYTWTSSEIAGKTALPANPDHTHDKFTGTYKTYDVGMVSQGWNWTLEEIKQYFSDYPDGIITVGQHYITNDNKTRLFVHLDENTLNPNICLRLNGTCVIDWGDDSEVTTITGTSTNTRIFAAHEYQQDGDYLISLEITSGTCTTSYNSADYTGILCDKISRRYQNVLWKVEFGSSAFGVNGFAYSFMGNRQLRFATSRLSDQRMYIGAFSDCCLKAYVGARGNVVTNRDNIFSQCPLEYLATPYSGFNNGYESLNRDKLKFFAIPEDVPDMKYLSAALYAISRLIIPKSITTIPASAYANMYCLSYLRFAPSSPPTIANVNAFNNLPTNCTISVPVESLGAYFGATNYPSPATYLYIAFKKTTQGESLPSTQDGYALTWYATKSDLLAQTSPITKGNGKEVYARYA